MLALCRIIDYKGYRNKQRDEKMKTESATHELARLYKNEGLTKEQIAHRMFDMGATRGAVVDVLLTVK